MVEFLFNSVTSILELLNLDFKHLPYVAVALVAIALSAAYFYCYNLLLKPKGCLDPQNFKEFKLVKKTRLNQNSARFRFALPTPTSILGLPVGKHIKCRGRDSQGEEVIRSYTPVTLDSDVGYFELVAKMYPSGKMSHHFREMKEGDYLPVKGPKGRFSYKPGQARAYGMIAGGSGITPMFQLTRAILENPKDTTKLSLIYANVTVDDILLKEELDEFANKFPDRFRVYYVLNKPPKPWNGGVGYISKEIIQTHCPAPATRSFQPSAFGFRSISVTGRVRSTNDCLLTRLGSNLAIWACINSVSSILECQLRNCSRSVLCKKEANIYYRRTWLATTHEA